MQHDIIVAIHLYIKYVLPVVALVAIPYLIHEFVKENRKHNEAAQALADRLGIDVKQAKKIMFHDPI